MVKGLYPLEGHQYNLVVTRDGRREKRQETPREDHLLCILCEKRIEIVETYASKRLYEIQHYQKHSNIQIVTGGNLQCGNFPPALFKLFVYSVLWRLSITGLPEYQSFRLPPAIEEEIRLFLHSNVKDTHKELMAHALQITAIPQYHFSLIKPVEFLRPPGCTLSAMSTHNGVHLICLVDYLMFFFTDSTQMHPDFSSSSNKQNEYTLIALAPVNGWLTLNTDLYNRFFNKVEEGKA
jgi:hypothetical protein